LQGIDQGAEFAAGHKLDDTAAALVPASAIGRMLEQDEAANLIRSFIREIPKRPAAASARGRIGAERLKLSNMVHGQH
jgi:hypothetical protein